jgi:hypothetical protein
MIRFKDDIAEAQSRSNDWWNNRKTDRACLQVKGRLTKPVLEVPTPRHSSLHEFWTEPKVVLPRILNELGSTWFGAEAFPVLSPVPGRIVSITCKYLGSPNIYVDAETTWSEPIIDDWKNPPSLEWNPDNEWWGITTRNLKACAKEIRDRELECYMGHPDLNGPTEVLAGLRNPEKLCMDLLLEPDRVKWAVRKVQDAWYEAWKGVRDITGEFGGCFTFMGLWSDVDAPDLQSDFSSLISSDMFAEFMLPLIREQSQIFPRSVFHLDGPDMIRHLDLLLEEESINAIQWVQGAGAGPVTDWMDVMRRIQDQGKSLYIYCEPWEVPKLLRELSPQGLMMVVTETLPSHEARDLVSEVKRLS